MNNPKCPECGNEMAWSYVTLSWECFESGCAYPHGDDDKEFDEWWESHNPANFDEPLSDILDISTWDEI